MTFPETVLHCLLMSFLLAILLLLLLRSFFNGLLVFPVLSTLSISPTNCLDNLNAIQAACGI